LKILIQQNGTGKKACPFFVVVYSGTCERDDNGMYGRIEYAPKNSIILSLV
jgi:hypothetical protein